MSAAAIREAGLGWIHANRDRFTLASGPTPLAGIKALGELALTAELLARQDAHASDARSLLEHAWSELDGGDALANHAGQSPGVVSIYATFHRMGYENLAVLERLEDDDWLEGIPRVPLQLPVALARRDVGLPERWSIDELVANTSILPRHPRPGTLSDLIAYTLTHTVFQMTTFGVRRDVLQAADRDYLSRTLDLWIRVYLERRNVDLVAEFVMTAHCIDRCCEDMVWDCLAEVQSEDGSLVPRAGTEAPTGAERFDTVLHPTLVGVMASAMCTHEASSDEVR